MQYSHNGLWSKLRKRHSTTSEPYERPLDFTGKSIEIVKNIFRTFFKKCNELM